MTLTVPAEDSNPRPQTDRIERILVVDDDVRLRTLLQRFLEDKGFIVKTAHDGTQMDRLMQRELFSLIVLDFMLPVEDGISICRRLRNQNIDTPIIMLTARGSDSDRIAGLEAGADDYLAKPFSVLELVARVRALLRRSQALAQNARLDAGVLVLGNLVIDPISREVKVEGSQVELTPREFDLLHFFVRNPGKVFSRFDLLNQVWGYRHDGYEHTVNTHINRLRAKVEPNPAEPARILTVWGRGYKFAEEGDGQ